MSNLPSLNSRILTNSSNSLIIQPSNPIHTIQVRITNFNVFTRRFNAPNKDVCIDRSTSCMKRVRGPVETGYAGTVEAPLREFDLEFRFQSKLINYDYKVPKVKSPKPTVRATAS